jgi:hypothetical protein
MTQDFHHVSAKLAALSRDAVVLTALCESDFDDCPEERRRP